MDEKEWAKLLKTYKTIKEVVDESLEGLSDHINTKCKRGHTNTVAVQSAGRRGLPPFREEPTMCDRGTSGCNLEHNDGLALRFAEMSLERIRELSK